MERNKTAMEKAKEKKWRALLEVTEIESAKLEEQPQQLSRPPSTSITMELEMELEGPHDHDHDHDYYGHINDGHLTSTSYTKKQQEQYPISLLAVIIEDSSIPKKRRGSGHKFLGMSKKARQQEQPLLATFKLGKPMMMRTTTTDQVTKRVFSKSENDDHLPREQVLNTEKLLKRPMVIQEQEQEENNVMQTRKYIKGSDGLVMPSKEELSDGTEEEWVQVIGPKISSGASTSNDNKMENKEKKKKIDGRGVRVCNLEIPNPSRELPDEVKRRISEMGGTSITLVITKRLTYTDCDEKEQRLSMPFTKLRAPDFLEGNEKDSLRETDEAGKKKGINVRLIEPSLGEIEINLRQWDMPRKSGGGSSMYVLVKPWKDVVRENGLKPGDAIQVWSFRVGNNKLRFALVKLPQYCYE